MISANNLVKTHQQQDVLRQVSFELEDGEVLLVLGPNGSGKTTLLKILALVSKTDGGEYLLDGQPTQEKPQPLRSLIGYVPQDIALYEELSVQDNLLCWSAVALPQARPLARALMQKLDLTSLARKPVRHLSGGMKRRVNLAVALLNNPRLLILDEPLVGVDIHQRERILENLVDLKAAGVTQVISTHHAGELLDLMDHVMVLNRGSITFFGGREEFQLLLEAHHYNTDLAILSSIQSETV